ncbi:hypothetical protein GCM10011511_15580 [Puia dinghuensis]|uniref:histidine kinase n=2 Tax=Puia dinghuensis TaxID=1792502 RepID=A0A8J2UB81_9BACT|nr:hypothetical protein GCM10011511_15580 [Puia dinghuensis]
MNWNSTLQAEVEKRTHELNKITEQRTNTLINLAHETKTPLTLIDNYLDEYIIKYGDADELSIVKRNLGKIITDISNIFDLERLNRGLSLYNHNQVTDFTELLNDNLALFTIYCEGNGTKLVTQIQGNVLMKADPLAINRIITNLLKNAIKFSPGGGTVEIELKHEGDEISFSVRDAGIGIPIELHKKIFQPYFQLTNTKASNQGMGLGLPIVKKVIEELNGSISIESDPRKAKGTKMIVSIRGLVLPTNIRTVVPIVRRKVMDIGIENLNLKEEPYDEKKKTILIVEDNVSMANYLHRKLKDKYNVNVAFDGNAALEAIQLSISSIELIITDIMMDKVDGFNLAKIVSEDVNIAHIPFLFVSAKATSKDKLQALKLGAIGFIEKPFSIEELMQQIEAILSHLEKQKKAILSKAFDRLSLMNGHDIRQNQTQEVDGFAENCRIYKLTDREKDIARLICEGKRYKDIGEKLSIAESTVAKHIQNIFQKVDVSNKIELIKKLGA